MYELNADALILWTQHRDTSPQGPLTPLGVNRARRKLQQMGPDEVQMASVKQSIHWGWQGLYDPKQDFAVQIDPATVRLS